MDAREAVFTVGVKYHGVLAILREDLSVRIYQINLLMITKMMGSVKFNSYSFLNSFSLILHFFRFICYSIPVRNSGYHTWIIFIVFSHEHMLV